VRWVGAVNKSFFYSSLVADTVPVSMAAHAESSEATPHSLDRRRSERETTYLSRKPLVDSALLSFDEPSLSPATNSIIDF
jgi:hypothetical protein